MLKICLIIIAILCILGMGMCIGILICMLAIDDSFSSIWPNYWERQEEKRKHDKDE